MIGSVHLTRKRINISQITYPAETDGADEKISALALADTAIVEEILPEKSVVNKKQKSQVKEKRKLLKEVSGIIISAPLRKIFVTG